MKARQSSLWLELEGFPSWGVILPGGTVKIEGEPVRFEDILWAFRDNVYPRRELFVTLHPLTEFYGASKDAEFEIRVIEKP